MFAMCMFTCVEGKRDRKRSEFRGSAAQGRLDQSRWPRKDPVNLLDSLHDFYVRTYRNLIHVVHPRRRRPAPAPAPPAAS